MEYVFRRVSPDEFLFVDNPENRSDLHRICKMTLTVAKEGRFRGTLSCAGGFRLTFQNDMYYGGIDKRDDNADIEQALLPRRSPGGVD